MKKWLVFCALLFLFLSVGILLFSGKKTEDKKEPDVSKQNKQIIENKANMTIRVKLVSKNEVVAMDINDYLRGVLASEMPGTYDIEALKAQAVVARTYTYKKMLAKAEGEIADMCDSFNHCQAFYNKEKIYEIWQRRGESPDLIQEKWSKINEAVVSTQGEAIMYDGDYINAYFHASSPVKTESVDQIWGRKFFPYLVSVPNAESEEYGNRTSSNEFTYADLEKAIKEKVMPSYTLKNKEVICIKSYSTSGRINEVDFGGCVITAEKLRTVLGLKSTLFTIELLPEKIVFHVTGYGHGVGMSQVGADYLAKQGKNYEEIIHYYYSGVEIVK